MFAFVFFSVRNCENSISHRFTLTNGIKICTYIINAELKYSSGIFYLKNYYYILYILIMTVMLGQFTSDAPTTTNILYIILLLHEFTPILSFFVVLYTFQRAYILLCVHL
jgi:hypothetical protein